MNVLLENCLSLKELSVKKPRGITDRAALELIEPGVSASSEALADVCPNLVKVKVKKCRAVTSEGANCWCFNFTSHELVSSWSNFYPFTLVLNVHYGLKPVMLRVSQIEQKIVPRVKVMLHEQNFYSISNL
ncbi:hypothetical protein LguiA_003954 [Lonicera macranthoides]